MIRIKRLIALAILSILLTSCFPKEFQQQADRKFGDQSFKSSIALIELYKIRFGEYPASLNDLKYLGHWDDIYITSVEYEKLNDGYKLNIIRGWVDEPELCYPEEFWQGLGIKETNVKNCPQ